MHHFINKLFTALLICCFLAISTSNITNADAAVNQTEVKNAINGAINYLNKELANDDNGMLDWAILGCYAAGQDVKALSAKREQKLQNGDMIADSKNTDYQRSILSALAAGKNPDGYGGINLLEMVKKSQLPSGKFADSPTGSGDSLINAHIWGIITLYAAGEDIPNADKALTWLVEHQNADGGFSIDTELIDSDIDMTAMAIVAMACLNQDETYPPMQKALAFLKEQQNADGSFGLWGTTTTESNAQVVQALVMLGIDPTSSDWTKNNGNPITAMLKYRLKSGAFSHGSEMMPNDMATSQALLALNDYLTGQSIYTKLHTKLWVANTQNQNLSKNNNNIKNSVTNNSLKIIVHGKEIVSPDQPPFIDKKTGRTYVPVRFVSEALGAKVDWVADHVEIVKNGAKIELKLGNQSPQTDAPAILLGGRTMVPLRFVSEFLGESVEFDANTSTVFVGK